MPLNKETKPNQTARIECLKKGGYVKKVNFLHSNSSFFILLFFSGIWDESKNKFEHFFKLLIRNKKQNKTKKMSEPLPLFKNTTTRKVFKTTTKPPQGTEAPFIIVLFISHIGQKCPPLSDKRITCIFCDKILLAEAFSSDYKRHSTFEKTVWRQ